MNVVGNSLLKILPVGFVFLLVLGAIQHVEAQQQSLVEVDKEGVMRLLKSGEEAAFFGVNYSPPFAHSYRTTNRLGEIHKKVIDQDTYHFTRLGFDGFRLHAWDTEISDSLGHLVENEHLDLLDYKLAKLKQRGIKVVLTPITYYDNGYPEPPTETDGFANYISKEEAPENPDFWPVIKQYLKEFMSHKNPYTGLTYQEDPNIIAIEIDNEPTHSGSQDSLTNYINMLTDHLRDNGLEKPIFYNIAQNPSMAEGVMNANIDGTTFQWYPGGLVGGKEITKNYLPYIDEYSIPFADKEAFKTKAQMVYEFDSADFLKPYTYPAMARSFREAGFQWATQFAYDPMAMGHVNTDYRTHYLNMAYTPAKAVSMKIASAAFHQLDRNKSYGRYPQNNMFGDFEVNHEKGLSQLNADTAFFYSNDTETAPKDAQALKHIAGVGNSSVVSYDGTGAYFLDKISDGIWRLEVMPDAIQIRDPFDVVSLDKWLTWIDWKRHKMIIDLPNLGNQFHLKGINTGNDQKMTASNGSFAVSPGAYLVYRDEQTENLPANDYKMGSIRINEFVAPPETDSEPMVRHDSPTSVRSDKSISIKAKAAALKDGDKVSLVVQNGWQTKDIPMEKASAYSYEATIPADDLYPGTVTYWITIDQENKTLTFPGGHEGHPGDWDYYHDRQYSMEVYETDAAIALFDATDGITEVNYAFETWNSENGVEVVSSDQAGQRALQVFAGDDLTKDNETLGWNFILGDKLEHVTQSVDQSDLFAVKAKTGEEAGNLKAIVVLQDGTSYSAEIESSNEFETSKVPFSEFKQDPMMLLPRPYPTFLPLWFKAEVDGTLNPTDIEEIQFMFVPADENEVVKENTSFAIESVWIEKAKN
ncbi:membrane or secreted protein [Aliifodinibius salipaludis]|uniref:Membrane or secreted protein n=1 Tax=Fodinibius salipaludis TaxID=2032627 RepID=A0A2A2GE07_9BACT|nr:membrane or secreted protein [Aliifodinibius salipaludis]PAU95598.1 membrane or secreted protein [Aliifodinibius salipaludis]